MASPTHPEQLLSPAEAAAALGVSLYQLRMFVQRRRLKPIRTLGGHRRYRQDEVLALKARLDGKQT